MEIKSITVQQLKEMRDNKEPFHLIDVREQHEYTLVNIGAELIPVSLVPVKIDDFDREGKVIVHCRSGARSANVIHQLQQLRGLDNLYNLEGGILAWAKEIDPSLPTY
jgi:adenylyltransferase/sulfurtransferase